MGHPPPPGWRLIGVGLHRDDTVAGYITRGVDVRGRCYQKDCRRSCWMDLGSFVDHGMATAGVKHLKALYKCNRLGGCDLEMLDQGGAQEIKLGMLTGKPHVFVQFHCAGCRTYRIARPDALLAKLKAEKRGDASTSLPDLGKLATVDCGCGAKAWRPEVVWCGERLPSWLQYHLDTKRRQRGELT